MQRILPWLASFGRGNQPAITDVAADLPNEMTQRMIKRLTAGLMLVSLFAAGQGRLGVQRYGHVVLPVKTLATSLAFYSHVLGLKSVAVPGSLASSQAWFEIGNGQQVRLVEGRTEPTATRSAASVGLVVASLRQAEQQLRQRGAAVSRQNPTTGAPSVLLLTDPDGYVLEFSEGKTEGPGFLQSTAKSIWRSMTDVD